MDDYEREAAREWQTVGPRRDTGPRTRPFIARANFEPDTEARRQWRERAVPTQTQILPKEFVPTERGPQRGRARGRTGSPHAVVPELDAIARDTQTEITQSITLGRPHSKPQLLVCVWGTPDAAATAIEKIKSWTAAYIPEKNTRSQYWAKVNNVGTPEQRDKYLAKVREEEEKESYRRDPPVGKTFPIVGKFEWDTSYSGPGDILGARLEACDPIRTDLCVFVTLDRNQSGAIRVQGENPDNVKLALNRLRGSFFQAISRDNAGHTEAVYLFNPVPKNARASQIRFVPVYPPGMKSNMHDESMALGVKSCLDPTEVDDDELRSRTIRAEELPAENANRLKKAMVKALQTAKFFRGDLRMRATFGVFLLKRYRRGVSDFEGFEAMMSEGDQIDGDVDPNTAQLGSEIVGRLLQAPGIYPGDVNESSVLPKATYSAKFLMKHKHDIPDLRFEAEFGYDQAAKYTHNLTRKWSRSIHAPGHNVKLLDICLVDLPSDSDAWSIDVDAMESIPMSRAPELLEFAEGVNLNPSIAMAVAPDQGKSSGRYLDFKTVPGVIVTWLLQKKHWTFEYGRTGYYIDVSKTEEFRLRNPHSNKPDQSDLTAGDPAWRVSIFRKDWDVVLAENAELGVGEGMRTDKTIADFFPASTSDGANTSRSDVGHFLQILNEVSEVIRGVALH